MTDLECIPPAEFATRRDRVLEALNNAVGLVFAGDHDTHQDVAYRPHPDFEYLTGVVDEPGAALLLDPTNPVVSRRCMLFLRPLNRERERWDGYRPEISASLRQRLGFEAIFRTESLPRLLNIAVRRSRRMACLHASAAYTQRVSLDLMVFRKVTERIPGTTIEDRSETLARMRSVKSPGEVAMIRRAIDITSRGFEAMMRAARPGVGEFEIQEAIEHAYRSNGSRSQAFRTIVGSGLNSTVLHYTANDQTLADGDLICVDSGAVFGGYAADVTRTVPVNGAFTDRQREVYELVLRAEATAIDAVKPGVTFAELDDAARAVIADAGLGDHFIHSIGHHLGLETHDATPDGPLETGAVITIEPGVYIPEEKIGVRIEDDVLVTESGPEILSAMIPKTVAEIESLMAGGH